MRIATFVAKTAFLLALMGVIYIGAQRALATGYVDYFYPKLTGTASGLIVGSSRESDGVSPEILERCMTAPGATLTIENFAFTYRESDFGDVYLDAIRRKVDPDTRDGVFIVGVNPAAVSQPIADGDAPPDDSYFRLAQVESVTSDPNLEYIRRFYGKGLYKAFTRTGERYNLREVHPDGWVEVRREIPGYTMSEAEMATWRAQNVETVARDLPNFTPSPYRLDALGRTIDFLGGHGRVWVIRMPVHEDLLDLERRYWPGFSGAMAELAESHGAEFFDYSGEDETYTTYDGSHLLGESARAFSRRLCEDLGPS